MDNISISSMIQHLGMQMQKLTKNKEWEIDITASQARVLMFIAQELEKGEMVFQKDVERAFNIKGSSVSSILNALEKNKWICREKVDYDARLKSIVLAEMSYQIMNEMREFWAEVDDSIRNTLSDAEFIVFCQCMEKIMKALPDEN